MPSTSVVVGSSVGLHARPAAIISEAAAGLGVTINGVDAGSSLMIMTLGAKYGDTVEVAGSDGRPSRRSPGSSSRTSTRTTPDAPLLSPVDPREVGRILAAVPGYG
jgi:phosphocarrier protein